MKKYEIILHDLEYKIKNKTYQENDLLPSENELVKIYDASRATIRQALKILEEKGLIQKQKGRGSVVIASSKLNFPISGLTSYKELQNSLGFESVTEVIKFDKITVDSELAAKTLLKSESLCGVSYAFVRLTVKPSCLIMTSSNMIFVPI